MLVSLIKNDKIRSLTLPNECYGIYWLVDSNQYNEEKNLISVEAYNGSWKLQSNLDTTLIENKIELQSKIIENYKYYHIYDKKNKTTDVIYCSPIYDKTYQKFYMNDSKLDIGKGTNCDIKIFSNLVEELHATLIFNSDNGFVLKDDNSKNGVYVNNNRVNGSVNLSSGDIIFICGVKIIVLYEENRPIVMVNNPDGIVETSMITLTKILLEENNCEISPICDDEMILFSENDYFYKRPRFKEDVVTLTISIDSPPAKVKQQNSPVLLTVGPMLTTSLISVLYGYMTFSNVIKSGRSWASAWPTLVICILSLMTTLVWPFIMRKYNKHRSKKSEAYRVKKYNEYIKEISDRINENCSLQTRILNQNSPSLEECKTAIETKDINLWNRKFEDNDFLNVSLGFGDLPMAIDLKVPEMHFSLEKDELLEGVFKLKDELPMLNNVPIIYNFFNKKLTATIGEYTINKEFVDRIIFQLMTLHSYEDLKIVVLSSESREKDKVWDYIKILPHAWSNDLSVRFYGTNKDEIREICYYLDNILNYRIEDRSNKSKLPFFLIITDNYKVVRNFDFIKRLLEIQENMGFSLFIINDKVFNLPAVCNNFINVNKKNSEIFQNVLNSKVQKFDVDFTTNIDMYHYSQILANIPIELDDNNDGSLVSKIGFLELYEAGKIEQLNVLNKWKNSNPMLSLQSLIGVGKGGEKIYLDLHEKYHGPHGLIAGMTGSGKSEFIATYILSLAINYHPYEVQFILIDYKGGGLAGIFENKITGIKLPHLIGTITNLDENEIKRSLASIESEIKRRQIVFGQVREQLGDSVVDIYKYQQLYRDGIVEKPISHLFIICDEFAELKTQQSEFLQQLISISRIGRSLGVHLILATQKPSGIVDNQIWSNSKFRVCLRVQEKSDSTEVIKCPDAAYLKNAGRFYLQVGYNEVFILGQAAWGGGKYVPSEKVQKKIDTTVDFINNIGYPIKKINSDVKNVQENNYGEEFKNIIQHLSELAESENVKNNNLWLDKLPEYINIKQLKRKYNFIKNPYSLDIPIGEYDIPSRQQQALLTIPFYTEGNVMLYGSTGSGKENFVTTMLYSSITTYNPMEVIYYIIDFGTEMLKVFDGVPHVGDIILNGDDEKIKNLFKLLFFMVEERKELFADYNGEYNSYCQNSENKLPSVVVIINNYDAYIESCSMYDEYLIQLTREGPKFGIYFLITVNNQGVVRLKLRQNFNCTYVLRQNSETDYSNILGNVNRKYPSKIFGRGIIKLDDIYEFQTAMVAEKDKISNHIENVKTILLENSDIRAVEVPVLPSVVTKDNILPHLVQDGTVVIGIEKDSLDVIKYDLKNNYVNLLLSYDINCIENFLNPFISQLIDIDYFNIMVINCEKLNLKKGKYIYYDQDFDEIFNRLYVFINKYNEIYINNNYSKSKSTKFKQNLCVIIGFDNFKNKLNEENKTKLTSLFEKGKDLELISYIFIESVDKMKKYEFDSWYKTVVNNSRGIFLGNGLADQMIIKLSKNDRSLREDIPANFCYVISHGRPLLIKYVEQYDDNI